MPTLLPTTIDAQKIYAIHRLGKSNLSRVENINYQPDNKGTQGFIGIDETTKTMYIKFYGTDSWWDWVINFNFRRSKVPYPTMPEESKIRVHKGWMEAYDTPRVRDFIHSYLYDHPAIKQIIVTGFSKGAAIATLCALDLQYNFPDKKIECYPIASPKVGNQHFVESFNRRVPDHVVVINRNDIVTKVPPIWTALFNFTVYQHVNNVWHIGRKPEFRIPFTNKRVFLNVFGSINDHFPIEYGAAIFFEIL